MNNQTFEEFYLKYRKISRGEGMRMEFSMTGVLLMMSVRMYFTKCIL